METLKSNQNNIENESGNGAFLTDEERKMLINSLEATLRDYDMSGENISEGSPLNEGYYNKVRETLREIKGEQNNF